MNPKKTICIFLSLLLMTATLAAQRYGESDDFSYALKLYNEGFYDIAAQQFDHFAERYPNSDRVPDAKYYQASSLFKTGDFENARLEFQALAVSFPNHERAPEAWSRAGDSYMKLGKLEEAARAFETVKSLYPQDKSAPEALLKAARAHLNSGNTDKAKTALKDLLDRYPDSPQYFEGRLLFAELLQAEQDYHQAFQEFQKVLNSNPSPEVAARAHLGLGRFYESLGQLQQSADEYQKVLGNYPESTGGYPAVKEFAALQARLKDYDSAVSLINRKLDTYRDSRRQAELKLLLAAVYYLQDNYFAARQALEKLQPATLPDSLRARLYFYQGAVSQKEREYKQSSDAYQKLLADEKLRQTLPQFADEAQRQLGYVQMAQGQFMTARQTLQSYLENNTQNPQAASILIDLFHAALSEGHPAAAREIYASLLKINPRHPARDDLLFDLAKYFYNKGNFDEAAGLFRQLTTEYETSAAADSATAYLKVQLAGKNGDKGMAVAKLAGLLGRMLNQENPERLKLELAGVYLHELNDMKSAVQLAQSVTGTTSQPALLGEANFILGEAYRRQAQTAEFQQQGSGMLKEKAQQGFKEAMQYVDDVAFPDSLTFAFLQYSAGGETDGGLPLEKRLSYWNHFVEKFPNSSYLPEARLILSDLHLENHDTVAAVQQLKAVTGSDRQQYAGSAHFRLGKLYFQQKKYEEAAETLKAFLLNVEHHRHRADAFALLGRIRERQGQWGEAAEFFSRLIDSYGYSEPAELSRNRLPQVFLEADKNQEALALTGRNLAAQPNSDLLLARLQKPENPQDYFFAGKAEFKMNDYTSARRDLLNYLFYPEDQVRQDETYYLLAQMSAAEGDKEAGLLQLQLITRNENSPFYIQAMEEIADIYFNRGEFDKAEASYRTLAANSRDEEKKIQFEGRKLISMINQGEISRYNGGRDAFEKQFKKNQKLDEYLAHFELELGKYYYRNKNFDRAEDHLKTVAGKYKKSSFADDADYYLGLTYTTLNKDEKAQEILTAFVRKYPQSEMVPNVYISLGNLYYRNEKNDLALGAFKKAVEVADDPETKKVALANLIYIYRDLGLWDGVLSTARSYVEAYPGAEKLVDIKIIMGSALIHLNRYSEAVEHLRKVKFEASSEQEPEIQFYIGEAYFNAGQYEDAIREFVKIPLLSKKTKLQWEASALYFSGQAYEKMGRTDDAIRMYQEIVDRPGIVVDLKREALKRIDQLKNTG
ncbi:MAG: tetratricopeptide repeat protein [Calditrichia bacterium]